MRSSGCGCKDIPDSQRGDKGKASLRRTNRKGIACDLNEIARDIKERDERDSTREIAPLKQAEDAVLVDSSHMTIEEVVAAIVKLCR